MISLLINSSWGAIKSFQKHHRAWISLNKLYLPLILKQLLFLRTTSQLRDQSVVRLFTHIISVTHHQFLDFSLSQIITPGCAPFLVATRYPSIPSKVMNMYSVCFASSFKKIIFLLFVHLSSRCVEKMLPEMEKLLLRPKPLVQFKAKGIFVLCWHFERGEVYRTP